MSIWRLIVAALANIEEMWRDGGGGGGRREYYWVANELNRAAAAAAAAAETVKKRWEQDGCPVLVSLSIPVKKT